MRVDAAFPRSVRLSVLLSVLLLLGSCASTRTASSISQPHSDPGKPATNMTGGIPTSDTTFAGSQRKIVRSSTGVLYLAYVKSVAGTDQVYVARSTDDGQAWSDFPQISAGPSRSSNPTIVIDSRNHLRLFWTKRELVSEAERVKLEHQPTRMVDPASKRILNMVEPGSVNAPSVSDIAGAIPPGKKPDSLLDPANKSWQDSDDEQIRQLYTSTFDGVRWSPQQQLTQGEYNGFPSAAYDSHGVLHLVWYGFDGRFYQVVYSEYRGSHWSQPVQISLGYPDSVNPSIAIDARDNLHVAWYKYSPSTKSYQINYREYSARQARWDSQKQISVGLHTAMNVSMAIDHGGTLYLAYDGKRTQSGGSAVYLRTLENGEWSSQERLSPVDLDASMPSLAAGGRDRIFLFYQAGSDGRIYLSTWAHGENRWTVPKAVSTGPRDQFVNARWSYNNYYTGGANARIDFVWTRMAENPANAFGANRIHYGMVAVP